MHEMRYPLHLLCWTLGAALLLAASAPADEYVYRDGQWVREAPAVMGTAAGELALMRQYVREGQAGKAVKLARQYSQRYAGAAEHEEVLYLAGQAEFDRGQYWQAYNWFEKQLDTYPNGELYEQTLAAEVQVAEQFLAGKKRIVAGIFRIGAEDEGLEILQRVAERLPASALAEHCLMTIADHHYGKAEWEDAADAYERYAKAFANHARRGEADLRAAQAVHNSYQGSAHDDTPLVEAKQRFTSFQASYPKLAAEADVAGVLEGIENDQAAKDYQTARFYARTGKPSASAFYYRQVVEQYGDTPWAQKSRQELMRMGQE